MKLRKNYVFLIIPFLALSLACQAITRVWEPPPAAETIQAVVTQDIPIDMQGSPTEAPTPTVTLPPPTPTATATPEPPTATPTPQPDTATPTQVPTATPSGPTPTPLPLSLQLKIFEELWSTVKDNYLYGDFNGLDWDAIHIEYREKVEQGLSNAEFYQTLDEMIFRLGDNHSIYLSPEEVAAEEAQYSGDTHFVGIGIMAAAVPERNRAVVLYVFKDSPAERAGLKAHDSILKINGEPALDERGSLRSTLRGLEGTRLILSVQTPGEAPRIVNLLREAISSPQPVPYQVLLTPGGKRVGYILLVSFLDTTIPGQVEEALMGLNLDGPLDGLIIDNRLNTGGMDNILEGVSSFFTHGLMGYYVSREGKRPLEFESKDYRGSQEIPLVVLVGKGTVSFGEIFAWMLQDSGRAHLIGETTDGNVEILWPYSFEDGSQALIAHDFFRPLNHPDANWEKNGIVPDEIVPAPWDLYTVETDPAVNAGLKYFDSQ